MEAATPIDAQVQALLHAVRFPGDADAAETREWLAALASLVEAAAPSARASCSTRCRTRRARFALRLAAGARHALRQHHPGARAAAFPRRPGDRAAAGGTDALERAGDGGARQPALRRARRPHRELCVGGRPVRGRLQPLLPRAHRRRRRRPGLLPAAFGAGRLCARLPRGPAERGTTSRTTARRSAPADARGARGLSWYPHPVADARLLAVPDRLDGHRARSARSTRRASCATSSTAALAATPRSAAQGLGRLRRRRDGRARVAWAR